ncbi:MAG: AbrB/MazE/SpoVT family DNA-binding domain-containing protein [Desulfuromonadales bacterium]
MSTTVTVSSKNQIVIPREAREKLHIAPGERLLVLCREDRVILIPRPDDFVTRMAGLHKEVWSDVEDYLARERNGWEP